ncbi:pyroglutamyl-peptidase I [Microbacterium sp. BLY]|uniref:pyroglutamyl-peptidase I family protein n=1 Tax=Microbacterium sp. BLY TaxID=2823280 RepID=UPI001B335E98|nr:pyroglutamyl-peptidase I [Microbacterium sp. BLY]MBP3978115.1 pyroglutamyl-peptidase I [Microbacterium sp. BLY]
MAVILLTGFDPFDGAARNPSMEAVRTVAAGYDGPHDLAIATLPVSFARAAALLRDTIARHSPDAVVCTGLAGGSDRITVERVGVNLMDARIPDNDGAQPVDEPSDPDGPAARFATLPTKRLVRRLTDAGLPARLSLSAGSYVCNHVLYTALSVVPRGVPAGFVHLPWSRSTAPAGAFFLDDEDIARSVRLVVDHCLDDDDDAPGGSLW